MEWIEMLLKILIGSLNVILIGNILYDKKIKKYTINDILIIITYTVFLSINDNNPDRLLKLIFSFVALSIIYKKIFLKDWDIAITSVFIFYLIIILSEIFIGTFMVILSKFNIIMLLEQNLHSIIINLLVLLFSVLISWLIKKQIKKIILIIDQNNEKKFIFLLISSFLVLTLLLNKINLSNWIFNYNFIMNIISILIIIFIILNLINQKLKLNNFINKYQKIVDYSDLNEKVLNEYRMKNHEYKNQLAVIKSLTKKNNKELNDYLDILIKNNTSSGYEWIAEMDKLSLLGLKGLINYKIIELKNLNIKISLYITEDTKKYLFDNLTEIDKNDLYTIVGVYLDNAKEAALETKNPYVMIEITTNDKYLIISITNTYKGEINKDELNNYNYSTKGKNRGIGLYIVKNIITKTNKFKNKNKITDKYFTQILEIKKD